MRSFLLFLMLFTACTAKKQGDAVPGARNYFDAVAKNDVAPGEPMAGEWRSAYNEPKQSFEDYKNEGPLKAGREKKKIYLLPLGTFTPVQERIVQRTREYLAIFYQLETILLDPVSDSGIPDTAWRMNGNNIQLYTPFIFNRFLKGKTPADGYALMAISEKDLYPSPSWNFVFGIASYKERIGVSSIFRLQNQPMDDNRNYLLCLRRPIHTASHEIGHMFSLHHCLFAKCVMNGSNNLPESDRQPLRLCSDCQKKLQWNIGYDNIKRLKELMQFLKDNQMQEDLLMLEKDFSTFTK